jgi:hypothetical protein
MKKTIVFSTLVALAVFLSGCGNKNEVKNQTPQDSAQSKAAESQSADQASKITGSIKDLLGMGKSLKCTATNGNDKFTSSSTTYISGKKVRSDIESQVGESTKINSHVIILDDWMYNWSDGSGMGMKLNMTAMSQNTPPPAETENKGAGIPPASSQLENKSNFECSPWTADDFLFTLPVNVVFTDQTGTINDMSNKVQQMPKSTCEMCDTIPNADAKAQCKANCSQK